MICSDPSHFGVYRICSGRVAGKRYVGDVTSKSAIWRRSDNGGYRIDRYSKSKALVLFSCATDFSSLRDFPDRVPRVV